MTLRCERMVHGGLCIAHIDDVTVMVDGGIPGELVEARLGHRKRRVWFATVDRALEPSVDRVDAPCPYVTDCGGCQLQHVGYARQLDLKREIVLDAMRRAGVDLPEIRVGAMDDPWRYRWRGEFHVVPGEAGLSDAGLGFNRARSWRPIAVDDCLIHHPTITGQLDALRALIREGATAGLSTLHLTVGENGHELLIRGRPQAALRKDAVTSTTVRWTGDATTLHWRGHTFRVTPESFIQVNWNHLDSLYGAVLDALGDVAGMRVVDGYAGIGVLSTVLAASAGEVVCIENNRGAAHMGHLNARINGVSDRMRYVALNVEEALPRVAGEGPIDALILDPPRAGCASEVTGFLALAGPPRIVYVSCDPATLARDLHLLVASGPYQIRSYDLVDMFPQTYHVESVVSLDRG
ncbi:MAG: class I SAM-dependent RNA methyltransferase [Candidatus Dormibacteria bacterium]